MRGGVILISAKQGAGKSTLAGKLAEHLGGEIMKFAEPLYFMHDGLLPYIKKMGLRPDDMKKDGDLLQMLGAYGRRIHPDVWAQILKRRIAQEQAACPDLWIVVDDCRFENEFDAFPDAIKIRLTASEAARKVRCSYWREDTGHPSEVGLDAYQALGKFDLLLDTELCSKDTTFETVIGVLTQRGLIE